MPSMPERPTANDKLAEIVATALVESGLVSSSRIEDLKRKLASGTAKPGDWKHWVESARWDAERGLLRKESGVDQYTNREDHTAAIPRRNDDDGSKPRPGQTIDLHFRRERL